MLSPTEQAALSRGQDLRRVMRAAAAMDGVYDDLAIADAVGAHRNTVSAWWKGATPEPATLRRFAERFGMSVEELAAFVYYDGPPPALGWPTSAGEQLPPEPPTPEEREAARRYQDEANGRTGGSGSRPRSPSRRGHATEG